MKSLGDSIKQKTIRFFSSKKVKRVGYAMAVLSLGIVCTQAMADDNSDPLAGAFGGLISSMSAGGGARQAAFLIEGIVAVATYIKTKNLLMMGGGIISIEIFFRLLMKMVA